jgi:hypothetical protein
VKVPLFDGCSFTLRPGRQQLLLGRQRLVSPLPWPNALRAWDGVAAIVEDRAFTATAFLTQFAPAQKYHFNAVNRAVDLGGLHATWRPGEAHPGFDAYGYWLHRDLATFNGTTGD